MGVCNHNVCGKEKNIWLPSEDIRYGSFEKHPWCKSCGLVKNISDDRPKKIGYWMNLFNYITERVPVTQVQKRLIAKKLNENVLFNDMFAAYGSDQKEEFVKILSKYISLSNIDIEEIIA